MQEQTQNSGHFLKSLYHPARESLQYSGDKLCCHSSAGHTVTVTSHPERLLLKTVRPAMLLPEVTRSPEKKGVL